VSALPVEAAWDVVGRKVSKERLLADIYETARTSIGLPLPIDAPAIRMFRMVIAEARSPSIGPIIALTILAEGGDLRRFGHQFLKFCGLRGTARLFDPRPLIEAV
jgi:hypothetical protein